MSTIVAGTVVFITMILGLTVVVLTARHLLLSTQAATLRINDTQSLAGRTGQKLLAALNEGGIMIPSACAGAGTCGLCRVTVTAGGGEVLPTERGRLSRADVKASKRLACQITIRSDMALRVDEALLNVESWRCQVRSVRGLAPLIKEIVLELPAGCGLQFKAGAYVQVTAPAYRLAFKDIDVSAEHAPNWERLGLPSLESASSKSVVRAYSIANTPADRDCVVLNVRLALPPPGARRMPPGVVSSFLFGLRPGASVDVAGPYGEFATHDTSREMVFIGGGVGMAPLRAMIFDELECVGTERKISFWYGARSRDELFYTEDFERLQTAHENFRWTVALSEPKSGDGWSGPTGFIHDVVATHYLEDHPTPEDCEYYLCGPPLMIQAVMSMLEGIGVDRESIFNDDFGS